MRTRYHVHNVKEILNDYLQNSVQHEERFRKVFRGCYSPILTLLYKKAYSPEKLVLNVTYKDEFAANRVEGSIRAFRQSEYYRNIKNDDRAPQSILGFESKLMWSLFPNFLPKCKKNAIDDKIQKHTDYIDVKLAQILSGDKSGNFDLNIINNSY